MLCSSRHPGSSLPSSPSKSSWVDSNLSRYMCLAYAKIFCVHNSPPRPMGHPGWLTLALNLRRTSRLADECEQHYPTGLNQPLAARTWGSRHAHVMDCSFRRRRTCLRHGTTGRKPVSERTRRMRTRTYGGVAPVNWPTGSVHGEPIRLFHLHVQHETQTILDLKHGRHV